MADLIPHKRGGGKQKGNLISVGATAAQKYHLKGILMGGINPAFIEKVRHYFSPLFKIYSAHIKKNNSAASIEKVGQ